ncbi:cyclophilin-like fold protein [Collinsella ihumii]|uniref:cyclophilin-like fold protein n=1 Tax=Collinsella ihumii TaxID=1720204 RepID=UPI0025AAFEFB|nr:cyclophilin-like fold protein [Collinsella ihumii]MDN0054652.1 cyclophilin-like fold protein [Collinsella ihumii]
MHRTSMWGSMRIRAALAVVFILAALSLGGCGSVQERVTGSASEAPLPASQHAAPAAGDDERAGAVSEEGDRTVQSITLTINGTPYTATLEDTEAARALAERLPLSISMSELNGNEKYCYLDEDLPTSSSRPGTIQAGDIMLFGSDCLVLFYETFSSGYSYTQIGRIDDPTGLAQAVGSGSVTVAWE